MPSHTHTAELLGRVARNLVRTLVQLSLHRVLQAYCIRITPLKLAGQRCLRLLPAKWQSVKWAYDRLGRPESVVSAKAPLGVSAEALREHARAYCDANEGELEAQDELWPARLAKDFAGMRVLINARQDAQDKELHALRDAQDKKLDAQDKKLDALAEALAEVVQKIGSLRPADSGRRAEKMKSAKKGQKKTTSLEKTVVAIPHLGWIRPDVLRKRNVGFHIKEVRVGSEILDEDRWW